MIVDKVLGNKSMKVANLPPSQALRAGITYILLYLATACAYENEEELFGANLCDGEIITYSEVVKPILDENCNIPACHDGSNPSIPDWTLFENVQSRAELIKERTENRTMPPSNSDKVLLAKEIDNISCWVDNGALDN